MEANVRNKILYLIQAWAHAFRNEPKYKVVQDTYQIMKVEGESWWEGHSLQERGDCTAPGGAMGGRVHPVWAGTAPHRVTSRGHVE